MIVSAASPPDPAWQAQWIGPALSHTSDMTGASWIWSDEAGVDPTRNAKLDSRFFRREIDLPVTAKVSSAMAMFTADNHFQLTVNGTPLGGNGDWLNPKSIDIAQALRPGANTIIVHAGNAPDSGPINAAGVIGKIRIEQEGDARKLFLA